jgi:hypothetical protein
VQKLKAIARMCVSGAILAFTLASAKVGFLFL